MKDVLAAMLVAASCAGVVQAQTGAPPAPVGGMLTLDQAIAAAGGAAPAQQAADAAVDAARAGRAVAGLRPNPVVQGQVENIAGSGAFRGLRSAETTVGVMVPVELGGKRSARMAVATAQLSRAELQAAIAATDVRAQVSQLYVEAIAADRRLATARDQLGIAEAALRAASIRVQAGRASPLEQQRADVVRITAAAQVERTARLADTVRGNLARRIGRPIDGALDLALLDRVPAPVAGPETPVQAKGTLALAAADADLAVADAGVRLARANRVPDLDIGPAVRRLEATNDMAAVFSLSVPIPVFNAGRAAIGQAAAERTRAEAVRRMSALDVEQAIADARAEVANAATLARAASGPALSAAQEAARIARIGYREGKFGQLDLLDAERTLADTRLAAIDALASYHIARARLERLTAPVPITGTNF